MRGAKGSRKKFPVCTVLAAAMMVVNCASHPVSMPVIANVNSTVPPSVIGAQLEITMGSPSKTVGGAGAYYIDCDQPSNGIGTQTAPWNSMAAANMCALVTAPLHVPWE